MKFLRSIFGESDEPGHPAAPVDAGPDPVMAALAELEVKRLREALAAATPTPEPEPEAEASPDAPVARPHRVVKAKAPLPEGIAPAARSIWDIEDEAPKVEEPAPAPAEAAPRRPTRTKTRDLGFEAQPAAVSGCGAMPTRSHRGIGDTHPGGSRQRGIRLGSPPLT